MLGAGSLFGDLFLIILGLWSIHGGESCELQLYVKRHSEHFVSAGQFFKLECPVQYCFKRPNITWCKFSGTHCSPLADRRQLRTSWEERWNISVFILHFEPVLPSDNGSYSCSASSLSHVIQSHITAIHITEQTQNNSERPLINASSGSGLPSRKEPEVWQWVIYSLLPLGGLLILLIIFFKVLNFPKRCQGKEKKPSDVAGTEFNLVDIPQPFGNEQIEESPGQNFQTLPSETGIYDNDSLFKSQEGCEVYSNPHLEGNRQGIVYASLNHSVIGRNSRQVRHVQEVSTEYTSICIRS